MVSVHFSPSRFTTLDECSSVALPFLDVLDLSKHLHRQRGLSTFLVHASCVAKSKREFILYSTIFLLSTTTRSS